jgi:hypothetical protein
VGLLLFQALVPVSSDGVEDTEDFVAFAWFPG